MLVFLEGHPRFPRRGGTHAAVGALVLTHRRQAHMGTRPHAILDRFASGVGDALESRIGEKRINPLACADYRAAQLARSALWRVACRACRAADRLRTLFTHVKCVRDAHS